MAASVFSRLDPFDCRNGDFDYYLEQFDHFLVLNSIDDETKKIPLFISSIGQDAYKILKESCAPADPKEKSFDELKTLLLQYFARRQFYGRNQRQGEQLGAFISDVKKLSLKCNFGPFAKEALRDRIACGKVPDDNGDKKAPVVPAGPSRGAATVQNKPVTVAAAGPHPKQTNKTAAVSKAKEVALPTKVTTKGGTKSGEHGEHKCKICGHPHKENECPHKDSSCFLCRKKGHIASVCREKNKQAGQQPVQVHVHVQQNTAMKN
ncbi:uncharacterized protein LOC131690285 [Topomyia yanbarensis]|uniref:uncharacterized protein LOC131690285 n=1 Tax=Topomyia yanbarensis TaxID=2498891 RepID=UPI00273C7FEB|nr:uncharacterized protein LOC131690285 [Topomyia yanbarensis]